MLYERSGSANLIRMGPGGRQTIISVLCDDGEGGDVQAGDGRYMARIAFIEPAAGEIRLQASVGEDRLNGSQKLS